MSDFVSIYKVNESLMGFDSPEPSILREISDYFSFFSPGYQFSPKFKNHLWDGKIRLANLRNRTMPFGLGTALKKFCEERKYEFSDDTEKRLQRNPDDISNFDDWLKTLNLSKTPRDYQIEAFKHGMTHNRGVLLSPTGSGKSLIIYLFTRWMRAHDRRVMIIVPTTSLVEQMISDFKEYAENDDSYDVDKEVNGLYGRRKCDPYESECTVATWQTLQKYPKELNETWDCVICDECHLAKAAVISKIVGDAINAPFKFGFTGSLTGENVHEIMLTGLFGEVKRVTTTVELQDAGNLSPLKIFMLGLKYQKEEGKALYKEHPKDWQAEVDYLVHHPRRNMLIRNLALKCKGTTMVFFNLHEHGEELFRLISEAAPEGRQVFHIDGRVGTERREEIRKACLNSKDTIIIASVGTSSTGINIPSIQNIILHNSKSRVRNLQSIGRGLRLDKMKEGCKVFDICDNLSFGRHQNYSMKHALARYKLYQEEGFTVKFVPIEF